MPPTAKQYKTKSPKSSSDVSAKESDESPEKIKVVSGQLQRSMRKKRKTHKGPFKSSRGVVFVKNLPHGFFEEQLQKYFQQFGKVTKVRLARSVKSGGSKGFAFIEFAVPEVAEIAAETMNNYLMFRKIVKAAYIPPDEQKFNYFRTSLRKVQNKHGKEIYVSAVTRRAAKKVNEMNNWTAENYAKRMKKTQAKLKALKRDLSHLGYDADSVVSKAENGSHDVDGKIENGDSAPASKKQKRSKSTSGESNQSAETNSSPAKSASSPASQKEAKVQSKSKPATKANAANTTLGRLLESTIEDHSSSDDDFNPNETFGCDNSSESDDSEAADNLKNDKAMKSKAIQNGKPISLQTLMDDTIEDSEDSSDDEFDPDNDDSNSSIANSEEEEENDDDEDEDEEEDESGEDSSPSKPAKHFLKVTQQKLDKIGQKKLDGGIRKKSKVQKPIRSMALKQKIQESAKEMAKQNKVTQMKAKDLNKGKKKRGL